MGQAAGPEVRQDGLEMKISPKHLKRYKDIALLLWKYGRSDLVQQMGIDETVAADEAPAVNTGDTNPEQLAADLEAMGPTYVKLGQVLSGRPDLLPDAYLRALARLHDKVKPFSYGDVEQIVNAELGTKISKAFSRFDVEPMAAASLGQVHFAALRDGRPVAVKVQRPGIREQIADDFEVLTEIAEFFDAHTEMGRNVHFLRILEEFRISIHRELNYELEASNLIALGKNLSEFPLIEVPQPILDYSTKTVLTIEYVRGRKITALGPLARLDIDGEPLLEELFKAYLKQVLVDGLFHADPHPGNVFLTEDGRIALLDLGMVGHTTVAMQEHLLKLLLETSEGNGEAVANLVIGFSETSENFDQAEFRHKIGQLMAARQGQVLQHINVGKSLLEVSKHATDTGLTVPGELTLLGKTLLQLDEIGKLLDPDFDPNAAVRRNVGDLISRRMGKDSSPARLFGSLLEVKDFVSGLPSRLNKVMDTISNHELEVKVKATDAALVMEGFQKVANRIATGLVLAALIVGASLLMQVRTTFTVWGYPGLAMMCFLAAAAGGLWLVLSIVVGDRKKRSKSS
jgi:predicted unusual protein kinase regulating ubiquinone biosynthesis (AarF/ABC1/UbiB family)